MKMQTWKKILAGVAICSMAASLASAISWTPPSTDVAYWDDAANWTGGVLPGADEKTQFSASVETECVVRDERACGQLVLGDGGNEAQTVNMRIVNGGILNAKLAGGSWAGVGYNRSAHCTVEDGGLFNIGTRLGVGMVGGGNGLLEVYGDITAAGVLQVSAGEVPSKGRVMLYGGGTISATGLEMGSDPLSDPLLDIWQDGVMTLVGDHTNTVYGFIAEGKILGNRTANNLDVALNVDAGVTNTVVTATPSVPNIEGLSQAEAADFLALYGYVIGGITTAYVPGALSEYVIGQNPAAGTAPLAPGSAIDIVVQETSVPDVIGLPFTEATNNIALAGLVVGTVTETYTFDVTPSEVLEQNPVGGAQADEGDTVDLHINEQLAAARTIQSTSSGDWMDVVWIDIADSSTNNPPVRETQNYEARGKGGTVITLTNKVAVKKFRGGINGTEAGLFQLDIGDGGHLVTAQLSSGDYGEIGGNTPALLNVYTNGIFESRQTIRFGWGTNATLNIDGGTVIADNWMSFGRNDDLDNPTHTETTIKNGGSLGILRFRTDQTNGVITIYDGTFKMWGTGRVGMLQAGLDAGTIKIADGYSYTLSNESGDSVITGFLPGYASWAAQYAPTDIGAEGDDYDSDDRNNFYEYALNGNATNPADKGVDPVMMDEGGVFTYTYVSRADDPNLVYTVLTTDDLVYGSWTNLGTTVSGTNVTGGDYNVVTNIVPKVNDQTFIRLKVANP